MVKILISAVAVMAVMSTTALACSGHKSGGKGSTTTAVDPAKMIVVSAKRIA